MSTQSAVSSVPCQDQWLCCALVTRRNVVVCPDSSSKPTARAVFPRTKQERGIPITNYGKLRRFAVCSLCKLLSPAAGPRPLHCSSNGHAHAGDTLFFCWGEKSLFLLACCAPRTSSYWSGGWVILAGQELAVCGKGNLMQEKLAWCQRGARGLLPTSMGPRTNEITIFVAAEFMRAVPLCTVSLTYPVASPLL